MKITNIRKHLALAAAEIEDACEVLGSTDEASRLASIGEQLSYYVEGDTTDPEASVYPSPGSLDTVQRRLDEVAERVDDDATPHIRQARSHLLQVIVALDDQLTKQREFSAENT